MRIPEHIIERLNSQADLVAIIKRHTQLKPAGREFKGCCPFHGEKTPSFYVNPQTNLYYCFGCGVKGNPIGFLRDFERMTFEEAVQTLSDQTGIDLPKDDSHEQKTRYIKRTPPPTPPVAPALPTPTPQPIPQTPPAPDEQGDLYSLLAQIAQYYQFMLHNTPTAKQYFLSRGLTEETIATFGLGYAPTGWQHLEQAFPQDIEGLRILGLVRSSQKGQDYDLLRDRVIFPIKDRQGRVVGFAGRSLGDEMPKYINSSESPVFSKQHILYGFYEARQARATDFMVVEGYMDVIALYQAGIYGAVAPMGTAVNDNQIAHLLKYNSTLTLCFDGDAAGQKAAWRALEVAAPILPDDKQLKFLTLPDNHDPDTYIKAHGADAMREAMAHPQSISDYVFDVLQARHDISTPEGKAQAMFDVRELTGRFQKGSSFKAFLNNSIFGRLWGKNNKPTTKDTANYDASLDTIVQLGLCLLYEPRLLCPDPLTKILTESKVYAVQQDARFQNITLPELPTWHSISPWLDVLVQMLLVLMERATEFGFDMENHDIIAIDGRAHFILASLEKPIQEILAKHWRDFLDYIGQQQNIHPLFTELLVQQLITTLKKAQENKQSLLISELHKRRLNALVDWGNKQKMATLLEKE